MKRVAVDLDGVLNLYDGWKGVDSWPDPRPGAKEFLTELSKKYEVIVWTTRPPMDVVKWMNKHELPFFTVVDSKPPCHVYIDDRAVCFDGSFDGLLEKVDGFKTHWEKNKLP